MGDKQKKIIDMEWKGREMEESDDNEEMNSRRNGRK
jgi:hypothetical protein